MSLINTPPVIKLEDWVSAVEFSKKTIQALQQLAHLRLGVDSIPTFVSVELSGLTASRLVQTNDSSGLASVSNLALWVLQGSANQVVVNDEGNGTVTLSTPQDIHTSAYPVFINTNTALSPMVMTGGVISAGTNAGTIKVAELTAMLRTTDSVTGTLTRITLAEQDNITLAAADTFYYVILTYGDPCTITTSATAPAGTNAISIGRCLKEADGTRHFASSGLRLNDGVNKLHTRATHLRQTEKDSGGGLVASTGTRNFTITAAHFHRGANEFEFAQKDTSDTDVFDYYYYNPTSGEWVKDDNTGSHYAALDNVQYNNVDAGTGLVNITVNKYTTNWIFTHPDDGHIVVVYGRSNGTLTTAQNEGIPPSLPDVVDDMGILLAKVIVRQGSNTLIIQNVEYFTFSPNITVDHNELSGLQGGTADEYYHMTAAEHTLGAAIMALTPTDGNIIVGDGATWITESGATARTSLGLGTGDSPTFANLSLGTGELTCGSINRAADTLTIEINGTPQISITSTTVTYAGDVHITGTTTYDSNIIIPDDGWIGSVTTNEAIQIASTGNITIPGTLNVTGDLAVTGNISLTVNNGSVGYTDNSPMLVFNNTDDQVELTGTAFIIPDAGYIGSATATTAIQIANDAAVTLSGTLTVAGASVTIGTASTTTGTLVLHDSNSVNTITLTVPNIGAGSLVFTLPATDGADTNVLQTDGDGILSWVAAAAGANHAMLDGTVHTDSVADDVSRGSIIYGNATPKWDELVKGAANTFLGSDGTDISYRTATQVMVSLSGAAGAAFDLNGQDLTNGGVIFLTEQAAAEVDVEAKGQLWVKTATPNQLYFTDDAGNDFPLGGFTNRGDPADYDYDETGDKSILDTDGTWHDLDLGPGGAGIVPANTKAVLLWVLVEDNAVSSYIFFRKNGNVNTYNAGVLRTQVLNEYNDGDLIIPCDANGIIEYLASNVAFTKITVVVKGWWT